MVEKQGDREQARLDAETLRNLLAAVVESSDDVIVTKTLDGTITSWNKAAERILGYTAAEAIGQSVLLLIPPERHHEESAILAKLRRGERIEHYETQRRTKDGRLLEVALTISPVRDATGQITGASKILRDVTARKAAARALEEERKTMLEAERAARAQAERFNASKDEFLATLSHELRTPLNNIFGWVQLLKSGKTPPAEIDKAMEIIERNVRLQTQLVDDLLDMSRIVSGQMRLDVQTLMPMSFIQAAIDSLRPSAELRQVRLESTLDPGAGPVSGDPGRLQQVVWNLVSNAIKFTPVGGRVQVMLERVNSHIEISVADTGIGITADFLPHVFERFRQEDSSASRRHGGLGLGLAIVKHIVDLHGGQVHAKSAGEGRGSTFRVQLPVLVVHRLDVDADRRHPRSAASGAPTMRADLAGLKVLAVDDEPDARALLSKVLQDSGAEVRLAASAAEALKLVESERPDVLISDIGMPDMDGYELLKRVRALGADRGGRLPAIALTAFARSEDRTRAMMAGYLAHISKPVEPSELVATVASVAGRTGR